MLQQMREAQPWIIKVILGIVVLTFVVTIFYQWGVQSSGGPTQTEVATIFGEPVSIRTFQRVHNELQQTYRQIYRQLPQIDLSSQFNFREMAMERLVRDALVARLARQNGVEVTDQELYERIAGIAAFQEQGRFDPRRYEAILRSQVPPILPAQFEAEQRQYLVLEKVYALVRQSAQVTEDEVEQGYRREHEQVAVRYVTLTPDLFEPQVTLTEEDVKAYYEAHKEKYQTPEQRQIRYVAIPAQRFLTEREFTAAEMTEYYTKHPEISQRAEQVRARHILVKVAENAAPEQEDAARARAEALLAELRGGADFAALATQHSEDTQSAESGGDLGFFPRGRMMQAFEEAAFTLPVGQTSALVRTSFGFHIIRVEDRMEAGTKSLAEVQPEITTRLQELQEQKAREDAVVFVDDLLLRLEEAPQQFAELAQQHGLPIVITSFVSASERVEGLAHVPNVVKRAFTLEAQAVDTVRGADGTHYLFQVVESRPAAVQELAALHERVTQDARLQKSTERAQHTVEEWVKQVQAGTAMPELAATLQLPVAETGLFKRRDPIPQLGMLSNFSRVAFELQPDAVGAAHEGSRHFVVQLTDRQGADMGSYEADKASYRKTLLDRKRQQVLQAFQEFLSAQYEKLRQQGDVVVNTRYVF